MIALFCCNGLVGICWASNQEYAKEKGSFQKHLAKSQVQFFFFIRQKQNQTQTNKQTNKKQNQCATCRSFWFVLFLYCVFGSLFFFFLMLCCQILNIFLTKKKKKGITLLYPIRMYLNPNPKRFWMSRSHRAMQQIQFHVVMHAGFWDKPFLFLGLSKNTFTLTTKE